MFEFVKKLFSKTKEEELETENVDDRDTDEILQDIVGAVVDIFDENHYPVSMMSSTGISLIMTSLATLREEGYKKEADDIAQEAIGVLSDFIKSNGVTIN